MLSHSENSDSLSGGQTAANLTVLKEGLSASLSKDLSFESFTLEY